jgi:hypothetical protein
MLPTLYHYFHIKIFGLAICCLCLTIQVAAHDNNWEDSTITSTREQALTILEKIQVLKPSKTWPNVNPGLFLQNLKENISSPISLYEGSNTNFCGYAALSYLPLHDDPVSYVKFMLQLYEHGNGKYGTAFLNPTNEIKIAAGTLKFKGKLDIKPADQMWFLTLADHFKGYVNFFNKNYQPGDENTFWASVNYAKFNRMIRKLFNYSVTTKGSDLLHPGIKDLYGYIKNKMTSGTTILYLNNAYLYKKKHNTLRPGIPTHYVILLGMYKINDTITITYWDYGFRSLRQVSPAFLKKIVFGITHCTKKPAND